MSLFSDTKRKIQHPRLTYLPFLLPRLHNFFHDSLIDPSESWHQGWFAHDDVPLKWQHPVGLLYDLFSDASPHQAADVEPPAVPTHSKPKSGFSTLPWKLTVHFSQSPPSLIPLSADGKVLHDAFINSVKEADHLRNGTAKAIMSLSEADSTSLWRSVETQNLSEFRRVNDKLLNPASGVPLRRIPIRVFLPTATPPAEETLAEDAPAVTSTAQRGTLKVIQAPVTPKLQKGEPQTLGMALNAMLPSVFPSRRSYIHALPVLHGAVVPMSADLEDLMRGAAYADGWINLSVRMVD